MRRMSNGRSVLATCRRFGHMPRDVQVAVCCMSDDRGVLRRVRTMPFTRITASECHAPHIERQERFRCMQAVRTHTARRTPSNGRGIFAACMQCGHMPQIPRRMPYAAYRTAGVFIASEGGSLTVIRLRRPVAAGRRGERFGVRYFRREGEALRDDPRLPGNIRRRCVTGRGGRRHARFPNGRQRREPESCRFAVSGRPPGKARRIGRTANRKAVLPEPKQLPVRLLRGDRQRTPHTRRLNGTDAGRSSVTSDGHQTAGRQSSLCRTAGQNRHAAQTAIGLPASRHPHTGERAEQTPGGSDSANIRRPIPPCQDPDALFPDFMENFPDFYRTFAR